MLSSIRLHFLNELEDLFTHPGFPSTVEDLETLVKARKDPSVRFKAARYLTDKVAALCHDHRLWTFAEQLTVYEDLLVGWERFCAWTHDDQGA